MTRTLFATKTMRMAGFTLAFAVLAGANAFAADKMTEQKTMSDDDFLAAIESNGDDIAMMAGLVCSNLPYQKGVLKIIGVPGDSARITVSCAAHHLAQCTATIAAGQTKAQCATRKVSVDDDRGYLVCSVKVLAGKPAVSSGCRDP